MNSTDGARHAGVVVGVHRTASAHAPVRWAAEQARRRHLPLTLVHAWREPISVTVPLDPHDLPGFDQPARSHAEPGRAADVLLAQPAALLVIGGHAGSPHLRHATRLCLDRARTPVAVVPEGTPDVPTRVVVGVDYGSTAADAALVWAAGTAGLFGSSLTAVHCWQWHPHRPSDLRHHAEHARNQERAESERLTHHVRQQLGESIAVDLAVPHDAPLDGLLRYVDPHTVLVVGQRTHARASRVLSGAAGDDLAGLAPCAVVTVPPQVPRRSVAKPS